MARSALFAFALLVAAAPAPPAAAANCAAPGLAASLDMRDEGPAGMNGFSVPVVINGQPRRMRIGLGPHTSVAQGFVDPHALSVRVLAYGRLAPVAKLASLALGPATGRDLLVDTYTGQPGPDDPVGAIGTGILGNFDMEIDFAAKKVNLFAHEACAGGGVHWAQHAWAVPFEMASLRRVAFAMTLDGKPVTVTMPFTGNTDSMSMTSAAALFGLTPDDPRIEALKPDQPLPFQGQMLTPEQLTLRRYTFGRLAGGDFVLDKPRVTLEGQIGDPVCDGKTKKPDGPNAFSICYGWGDLALGLDTLRKLHLYFAFQEQVLYVTPAAN